ncbi:transposase [Flavobacterium ajazii]|uniref:transposase n=1 Tax=Flavobacterium ajazii TaxID=2692318 RepID=UPI0013D4DCD1|nr:transposase [Flavobacterium ajazii]
MALFKNKFKVDSNRLKDWDYSNEAVYFITIATKNRESIFGSVEEGKMILNSNGEIVENELLKSIKIRKNWFFHNWVVMPNHIHLLIEIQNKNPDSNVETHNVEMHSSASPSQCEISIKNELSQTHIVETHSSASNPGTSANVVKTHCCASLPGTSEPKLSRKPDSISSFVAIFKSVTTKQINGTETIWQSNYHDHIVRNYKRFEIIYDYIKNNPQSWDTDSINSNFQ